MLYSLQSASKLASLATNRRTGEIAVIPGGVEHEGWCGEGCAISGRTTTTVDATAPADGNIAPPGYYLLFLVDQDRVPSVAKWIRLTP